jgi:hypothetical protein
MRLLLEAIVERQMLPLADTNAADVQTLAEYLEFAPFQAGERVIQKCVRNPPNSQGLYSPMLRTVR